LVASVLALSLANMGFKTGLFDADFTSPSTHRILGVKNFEVKEERGLLPMQVYGLEYMSIVAFSRGRALPLRGADISNTLIELFSTTLWGSLDYLMIDMPPGISDATLDVIRLVRRAEFLIVSTPSSLAFETVEKLLELLRGLNVPVIGVLENMKMGRSFSVKDRVVEMGVPFLGELPFDPDVEDALGNVDALSRTAFARKLAEITPKIISPHV
ncbi:MAG: P-loop NTPase, partial [Candidatus Bathyarchaeia archaeon]